MSDFFHLEILLEIGSRNFKAEITEAYVLNSIVQALNNLFGEVGAATPIEVEKFESQSHGAYLIVKCPSHCFIKLRSSLTLHNTFQSLPCAFHIVRFGNTLLELHKAKPLIKF